MTNALADLRYAIRTWRKQPFLVLAVILAIAVAIGASVAIFSVLNAVLIKPLPYNNQQELVVIWDNFLRLHMENLPAVPAETVDYANLNQVFEDVAGFRYAEFNLLVNGQSTRALGTRVSANLFSMIGSRPLLGRVLLPSDEQSANKSVAMLSYGLWQRMTGGNPGIVGQTITLNRKPCTVVGVMPPEFQFPLKGVRFPAGSDLWTPAQLSAEEATDRNSHTWFVVARLKAGMSLSRAQANMDDVAGQLDRTYPNYRGPGGADGGWKITVRPLVSQIVGDGWFPLALLSGAVGLVFLIACANIASLLLARATDRQSEITIRSTLGASRWRILQQLLTESLLFSVVGGALGVGLATTVLKALLASYADAIPRLTEAAIDGRVLLFTIAIIVLAATLFGLAPALHVSNPNNENSLRQSSGRGSSAGRYRKLTHELLVSFEIAMALVLLIGAGLLVRSFHRILSVDPGFDATNSLAFTVSLDTNRYPAAKDWTSFYQHALESIQSLPGVKAASVGSVLPLESGPQAPFSIEGRAYDPTRMPPVVRFQSVGPAYFHALGIPLIAGRDFASEDIQAARPVVVINEAFANQFFPAGDELGKQIKIGAPSAPGSWLTIIGIAKDARSSGLDAPVAAEMYVPFPQRPQAAMSFVIKTTMDPHSLLSSIRQQLQSIDKEQPIFDVRTIRDMADGSLAPRRFSMLLTAILAGIALVLAVVGLFGMISYTVARRTREMAVRMALGAQAGQVQAMVLAQELKPALIGAAAGLLFAFVFNRIIASMLFGLTSTDLVTYFLSAVLIVALAMLASYMPARRIARIQIYEALHYE